MRAKIFFCALGIILLAALFPQFLGESQYSEGPCFVFPKGTNWYLGSRGYHHGCEDGSCTPLSPITGYDLITAKGVPILAPFDGVVSYIGEDGLNNTVLKFQNEERTWEMGFLHANITARQFQGYKAGEQLALNDSIGNANGIPHPHLWFRNMKTNTNTPDHDQFWNCIGSKPGSKPPTPPPPTEDWFGKITERIQKAIESITNFFKGIKPPDEEPPVHEPPRIYEFRISYQKPGNIQYQHNIRVFFAWVSSGYDLEKLLKMDLQNFVGSWEIKPGETSVNEFYGTEDYEQGQGMVIPPGFGIGDGACHTASMVAYVLSSEGLVVVCDDPTHQSPIPGVPNEWNCTVCIPTDQYPCTNDREKDIEIDNQYLYSVKLNWQIEEDIIRLWVVKTYEQSPATNFNWLLIVLGIVFLLFLIWLIFFRRSDKTGQFLLGIADNLPLIKKIIRDVFNESKNWTVVLIAFLLFIPSIIRDISYHGFSTWFSGESTIKNWLLLLSAVLVVGTIFVNAFMRTRYPTKVVYVGDNRSWKWIWLVVGIAYLVFLAEKVTPVIDILVVSFCIWQLIPRSFKRCCLKYGCILLIIVILVPAIGTAFGIYVINQAIESAWEGLWEFEIVQKAYELIETIEEFTGINIPFPSPPARDGPYGSGILLPLDDMITALIQSRLQQPNYRNIRLNYNEVVRRSKSAGYDPAISMSIWIEESGASNYYRYPGVADFGCISKKRMDFNIQFTCWLGLWESYSEKAMFRECRGEDDLLSLREFLLIYEGGYRSCRKGNFIVEPGFPKRLKDYYEVVTDGGKLDF